MERRAAIEAALADLPLMLTVEQTRGVLGIGRSLAYAQVRRYLATNGREGIPAVRIGTALRIPRAGLVDLLSTPAPPSNDVTVLRVVPTIDATGPRSHRSGSGPMRSSRRSAPSAPQLRPASSD
jgi:hypothetical protein